MSYGNSSGHYRANPGYYRERNRNRRNFVRAFVQNYKESHPCKDCGVQYPYYVMEFDHLDNKTATVSRLAQESTLPRVLREIEKCEVVCSNCHAERTYRRGRTDYAPAFEAAL